MLKNLFLFLVCALLFFSCSSNEALKFDQYLVGGQDLYTTHCSNCHVVEGKDLKSLYPPLYGSDYINNMSNVICVIKNGAKGPMVVNGKMYNQVMPKNNQLYDLDIAQITTYINHKWGKQKNTIVETETVKNINCSNFGQ